MTLLFATVAFAQFPAPYCGPLTYTSGVEPITSVNFAGIDNVSDAATGGTAHEDYTSLTANVDAGSQYTITLQGNSDGPFTNRFIVFFDWNHDGNFSGADEAYPIAQTINSSTGTDGITAVGTILVPSTALPGATRMRVKKLFGTTNYTDPCVGGGYGQVEDYSVVVTIPSCAAPGSLAAVITSPTTATLSWSSTSPSFEVVVQPQGSGTPALTDGTGVNVAGNTYTATLDPATPYEFYVRTECTAGTDFSTWSGPFLFDTTQAPACVLNPFPADAAVDVPVGDITFTWESNVTGDAADSYDLYAGNDPSTLELIGNFDTTSADLVINTFGTTIYWQVVPMNAGGSATGCAVFSFTTQDAPGYCLNAPNGQWPGSTYVPTECDGITQNVITPVGFAGEYSKVTVTNGQNYIFTSAATGTTDFITISDEDGLTPLAYGNSPLTWVSTVDATVRFYSHTDDQCGDASISRTRSIVCGTASADLPDYVSLQFPATLEFAIGENGTVYGQVYEAGLTDVVPNIVGQAPGITADVVVSPLGQNTNPNTWTTIIPAGWNAAFVGNNDEYFATIEGNLDPGVYYYAMRFRLNSGAYVYGGINSNGDGNFWDGTTFVSGVLTLNAPPAPANDLCADAVMLTAGQTFEVNPVMGTLYGATDTAPNPSCSGFADLDVWYTVTVPASGNITLETQPIAGSPFTDSIMTVYSGTCGALTELGCNDDGGVDNMSLISLTGLTPGAVLYVIVYKYSFNTEGNFMISAYDQSLKTKSFDSNGFTYFPNPVKDVLNLSYAKSIDSISVYNLLGQEILTKQVNASQSAIDMSAFANGAYMVKVSSDNQVKTIKVIKQ